MWKSLIIMGFVPNCYRRASSSVIVTVLDAASSSALPAGSEYSTKPSERADTSGCEKSPASERCVCGGGHASPKPLYLPTSNRLHHC